MKKLCFLCFMMMLPIFVTAQNEASPKQTKYEEFVSKTGYILKFVDKNMKNCLLDLGSTVKCKIRTVYGEGKNRYYFVLEKGKNLGAETTSAFIEYSDLVEINKAYTRLLNEEKGDCNLSPDYLQNMFTSEDGFKIGYYVEKSKAYWKVKLGYGGDYYSVKPPENLAECLRTAQREIEAIMAKNGK